MPLAIIPQSALDVLNDVLSFWAERRATRRVRERERTGVPA